MKCDEIFGLMKSNPTNTISRLKLNFKSVQTVYKSLNRTSFVLKSFKLHACMQIIAKIHFYISSLVTRIIIKSWTLLKVTEEKFKNSSFLGSIVLHLHMHNSLFRFLCSHFVNYITN